MTVSAKLNIPDHLRRIAAQEKVLTEITVADGPCMITVTMPGCDVQVHQGPGWRATKIETDFAPLAGDA